MREHTLSIWSHAWHPLRVSNYDYDNKYWYSLALKDCSDFSDVCSLLMFYTGDGGNHSTSWYMKRYTLVTWFLYWLTFNSCKQLWFFIVVTYLNSKRNLLRIKYVVNSFHSDLINNLSLPDLSFVCLSLNHFIISTHPSIHYRCIIFIF